MDTTGSQALTVNPSTDLLVTAQYAPVSEVVYQPPQEDTEQSKLMPQDNKELRYKKHNLCLKCLLQYGSYFAYPAVWVI